MLQRTAKLFKNGSNQAVRLPADFRFDGDEVYLTRDAARGDVVLSTHPAIGWDAFLALAQSVQEPARFLSHSPMNVAGQS